MNVSLANRNTPCISVHHVKDIYLETQPPDEDRYVCSTFRVRCDQSGDGHYSEIQLFSESVDNQLDAMENLRDELTKNIDAHREWRMNGQFEQH